MRRTAATLFLVLVGAIASAVAPRTFSLDDPIYARMELLYISSGMGTPSNSKPWSSDEARLMLDRIDESTLSDAELRLYRQIEESIGDDFLLKLDDVASIGLGGEANLDKVAFDTLRKEIVNQYLRGGMVSLSWHARNPKTGGDAWDVTDTTVVKSILPGGECHQKFAGWLGSVASFINSLQTADGVKVPVLFRPWHEHTGSWFWWGEKLCTPEDYKELWHMTVDTLRAKGVDNVLFAYSPGSEPRDTTEYLRRYPGDDLIDLIGFDTYQFNRDVYLEGLNRSLAIVDSIGKAHDKVIAVTETGYEGIPDAKWWTGTLLPALEKYPVAYVLVWRNAREKVTHFYAPYPGQASEADFVEFYKNPKTLFAGDVKLYAK